VRSLIKISGHAAFMFGLLLLSTAFLANRAGAEEHFSVKEYNQFHDVLHPLEHEALPKKDFQRIRTNAAELVKRGKAIVQVGLPSGTPAKHHEEFRKELKKFEGALGDFSKHAQDGTDAQLEASFSAVHDSFEMLVGMLPRK
jgi:hypothetical protein